MQTCPNCGYQNPDTSSFCAQCGVQLQAGAGGPGSQPQPKQTLALSSLLRGRYLIKQQLAKGGMGAVYLAEDLQFFNKLYVVKELLPYYTTPAEKQQAEQNFEREARLLASLHNPGVPQVFDYFIEGGNYYLVMEWVEGENLEHRLGRAGGRLPEKEVLDYAIQLANILVYMHKQQPPVIHRDIKPSNIIVDASSGQVKLVDFGLAKATSSTGQTGRTSMRLGTPGYAPPEQYSGTPEPRTDIYALGATLHHLLTGRDPRNEAPFQFPPVRSLAPSVSAELDDLIQKMLQTDTSQRPSALEVRTVLDRIARPMPVSALPFAFRSGDTATDATELALICDRNWAEAVQHLYSGHFEQWLRSINRHDLATRAEAIRLRGGDQSAGLEEFLRAAHPTMPLPVLSLDRTTLDFGSVERGDRATEKLRVTNVGRGYLVVEVKSHAPWARAEPASFGLMSGQSQEVTVTVDTAGQDEGLLDQPTLEFTSNGGMQHVSCRVQVTWQPQLEIEPAERVDFGEVLAEQGGMVSTTFVLRNTGGGVAQGRLSPQVAWLTLDHTDFYLPSSNTLTVTATADPSALGIQKSQVTALRIEGNTGVLEVPAYLGVKKAWYTGSPRIQQWLAYGLLVLLGALLALVPVAVGLLALFGRPLWSGTPLDELLTSQEARLGVLLGLLLLSIPALYFSQRWVPRLDEMENYHHRGDLDTDTLRSRFSRRKVTRLAAVGALLGLIVGWRFGEFRPGDGSLWLLLGLIVGLVAGGLLAAEGEPLPAESKPDWMLQPAYAIGRTVVLLLAGSLAGIFLGELTGHPLSLYHALLGGLVGLVLSSESHRLLAVRLRWLLGFVRGGLLIWLGAYSGYLLLALLRTPRLGELIVADGYLFVGWLSLGTLFWLLLVPMAMVVGGLGGLWTADSAGQPFPVARRSLLNLIGSTALVGFLPYLVGVILAGFVGRGLIGGIIAWACLVAAGAGLIWVLHERLNTLEAVLTQSRSQVWPRVQAGGQHLWARVSQAVTLPQALQQLPARLRLPGWVQQRLPRVAITWPSLDELAANLHPVLVVGALAVTGLAVPFVVQALISLAAFLVPLIILLALAAAGLWLYQRSRTP